MEAMEIQWWCFVSFAEVLKVEIIHDCGFSNGTTRHFNGPWQIEEAKAFT
jgi:hypothetical protein